MLVGNKNMPLSFANKITPVTPVSTINNGLSFADKITNVQNPVIPTSNPLPQTSAEQISNIGNILSGNQTSDTGALFSSTLKDVQTSPLGLGTATKAVANVVPDFVRTTIGLPTQTAGLVGQAMEQGQGLIKESGGTVGAIKNLLSAFVDPKTYIDTLKAIIPSAAQKVVKGDFYGAAQDISNHPFQQIAPFLLTLEQGAKGFDKVAGTNIAPIIDNGISKTTKNITQPVKVLGEKIQTGLENRTQAKIQNVSDIAKTEWQSEANNQKGKAATIYNKAENRNIDIPQILTDKGITSYSLMGDEGKFNSKPKSQELNGEASNLYKATLNPLIENSDKIGATLSLGDLQSKAIAYAKDFNTTTGNIADAIDKIDKEFANRGSNNLTSKFNKGIKIGDAESEKTAHWGEIDWSKIGGKTTPDNIFNSAMGYAYQGLIEASLERQTGLPQGVIKNMNAEIGKLRQTADFLDQIHGDKPVIQPSKSVGGKMLKQGLRVGIGGIADVITHGIGGGIAGYLLSKPLAIAISEYLLRLPEAMRIKILSNMQATEPAVVQQVMEHLAQERNRPAPLQLPEPAIQTRPPQDTSGIVKNAPSPKILPQEMRPNQKALPAGGKALQRNPTIQLPGKGILKGQQALKTFKK